MIKNKFKNKKGITLFIAIVIMGILLFISFAVINIAIKGSLFASSGRDSQYAFYAADSGVECALYWDSKVKPSAFSTGAPATWAEIHVVEFSGIDQTSPLDQTSSNTGSSNSNPTLITTGTQTINNAKEMIFGYTDQWLGSVVVDPGVGFTKISGDFSDAIEYKNVTVAAAYDASFSISNPSHLDGVWGALMTTFIAAVGKTPAFIQHKANDRSLGSAQNITLDNPSTSGNTIILSFQYDSSDFNITSITDNKGNIYKRAIGPLTYLDSGTPRSQEIWYAKNIIGGGVPIKITANSPAFVPVDINCNTQHITSGYNASIKDVNTKPLQPHRVGGGGLANPTSIFQLNLPNTTACAIVEVTKDDTLKTTHVKSKGYNTCDTSNNRRVERGVEVTY